MTQNALRPRLSDLALITYLAPLLTGKRVAIAGSTSGEVAQRARALGAHTVISFGGVGEDIAVRPLTPGSVASFHGRLDVLVVPDATAVPSLVALLDEARRALGSEGVVVVGAEPPQSPRPMEPSGRAGTTAYHDLYDLCAARFANVRMLGRGPFVGYTLATFDDASDRVALDTRLIDGDPPRPESFIAVASDSEVALDPIAVVQVPDALLETLREGAAKALEEKLAERDQKLKEVEAASAERWVKIQRYEHGLKELEEENRKAREKVVRASKELEDERKLRQRIELDAQMSRRAPELPKAPDLSADLQRAKDEHARVEADLRAAREAAARDLAAKDDAVTGLQSALAAKAGEVIELRTALDALDVELGVLRTRAAAADAAIAARDAAVATRDARLTDLERELDETQATEVELHAQIEELQSAAARPRDDAAAKAVAAARDAALASLAAARAEASSLRASLDDAPSHDAVAALEARLADRAAALRQATAQRDEALTAVRELALAASRAPVAAANAAPVDGEGEALRSEVRTLRDRVRALESEAVAFAGQAQQSAWRVDELEAALAFARTQPSVRGDDGQLEALRESLRAESAALRAAREAVAESRAEVSRLYAENVSLEARLVHAGMELDGLRAGFQRRVAELEREVERLLRALEVVGAQTGAETGALTDALTAQVQALEAERQGIGFRLREAESALSALAARPAQSAAPAFAVEVRADQALSDLGRTAERLAATEESLREAGERIHALEGALAAARRDHDLLAEQAGAAGAQLDERDRRLAEFDAQHREQLVALRDRVAQAELRAQAQREVLASVRSSVSAILADGRGALVAHDLLQILRTVEGADGG
jgi:chromosome segregation ATPase